MIATTVHLLACIALALASLYWRQRTPEGDSIYRHVLPFVVAAGFLGLPILRGYFMEFFVASYSGVIDEAGGLTGRKIAWIAVCVFLTPLPLAGLIPDIGRQSLLLLVIACLAAIPSAVSILTYTLKSPSSGSKMNSDSRL